MRCPSLMSSASNFLCEDLRLRLTLEEKKYVDPQDVYRDCHHSTFWEQKSHVGEKAFYFPAFSVEENIDFVQNPHSNHVRGSFLISIHVPNLSNLFFERKPQSKAAAQGRKRLHTKSFNFEVRNAQTRCTEIWSLQNNAHFVKRGTTFRNQSFSTALLVNSLSKTTSKEFSFVATLCWSQKNSAAESIDGHRFPHGKGKGEPGTRCGRESLFWKEK